MIVITGSNGFIGSNAVADLVARGGEVVAVDDYPSIRGCGAVTHPCAEVRYNRDAAVAAYVDMEDLAAWLSQQGNAITGVVHLGACSDTTVTDRDYVMRVNTEYTRTLWRWCTETGTPFVYASSAATYGDGSQGFDDEADPRRYKPMNLYGESKHIFDLWALEQTQTPPRWAGLKYFNIYGPNESHKGRMASMAYHWFHQIRNTGRARLFKSYRPEYPDGGQMRDFCYVKDAVAVTLNLLTLPASDTAPNGLYNVGTGQPRTFADLARAVFTALEMEPVLEYIEMPADLRNQYQYYTAATVAKRERAGLLDRLFATLEEGVRAYVQHLLAAEPESKPA